MADILVGGGYRDAGYEYVAVDDCWMERQRDARGRMQPDAKRFPSGMAHLADYVSQLQYTAVVSTRRLPHAAGTLHNPATSTF